MTRQHEPPDFANIGSLFEPSHLPQLLGQKGPGSIQYLASFLGEEIWALDDLDVTTYVSPKLAQLLGYHRDEILNTSVYQYMDDEAQGIAMSMFLDRKPGGTHNLNFKFRHRDGNLVRTQISSLTLSDSSGQYAGRLLLVRDATRAWIEEQQKNLLAALTDFFGVVKSQEKLFEDMGKVIARTVATVCSTYSHEKSSWKHMGTFTKKGPVPPAKLSKGLPDALKPFAVKTEIQMVENLSKKKFLEFFDDEGMETWFEKAQPKTIFVIPLTYKENIQGTLVLASEIREVTLNDLSFLAGLGRRFAHLLSYADLLDRAKKDSERASFVAEASRVLVSTLSVEDTLLKVAELAANTIADHCVIDLLKEEGKLRHVVVASKKGTAQSNKPQQGMSAAMMSRILEAGRAFVGSSIDPTVLSNETSDPKTNSYIHAPLRLRGRDLGVLTLLSSAVTYGYYDATLAEELARLIAVSIENTQLYQDTKDFARRLQVLTDALPAYISYIDTEQRYRFVNNQYEGLFKRPKSEILGKSVQEMIPPSSYAVAEPYIERALKGENVEYESYITAGEETLFTKFSYVPDFNEKGNVKGFFALLLDMTKRKAIEEKLEVKSVELKRSNDELARFAAIASHDLQEPLRTVASYSQLLQKKYSGKLDESANEFIYFMTDAVKRMQRLIADLLIYSRVGRHPQSTEATDSTKALQEAIQQMAATVKESGAQISYDSLPKVWIDETQLVQIFQNLLSNAIKFRSQAPPQIHVFAQPNKDGVLIGVSDNGIGIDTRYFNRIFDVFQRLHPKEEYPGSGLGLAICKKIIDNHGGRIWIESQLGKGSTFYFVLPTGKFP